MADPYTLKKTLQDFAKSTTAHRISRLVEDSTSWFRRLVWLIVCSVAFVLLVMQLVEVMHEYHQSPKITNTKLVNEPIPFPSVSVCSLRGVDLYNLQGSLRILCNGYINVPKSTSNVFESWKSKNQSNIEIPESSLGGIFMKYYGVENLILSHLQSLKPRMNMSTQWSILSGLLSPTNFLGHLSKDIVVPFSTMRWTFIATCVFQYKECTYTDFNKLFSPQYYNCYTFNVSRLLPSSETLLTGPHGGLSLLLSTPSIQMCKQNANLRNYKSIYDPILSGDGIRVIAHSQDDNPDVINKGDDIPNGFSSSISLRVSKFTRYNTNDSPCLSTGNVSGSHIFKYSQSACFKECAQKEVRKRCNCVASTLLTDNHEDYPVCGSIGNLPDSCYKHSHNCVLDDICKKVIDDFLSRIKCERTILASIGQKQEILTCYCPPLCHEYVYDMQYGLSHWPTLLENNEFKMSLSFAGFFDRFESFEKQACFSRLLSGSAEDVAEFHAEGHFNRLNVYLSDSTALNVEEVPRYKCMQAVSDVGGQMGLWMGVSLITLAEIIYLLVSLGKKLVSQLFTRWTNSEQA